MISIAPKRAAMFALGEINRRKAEQREKNAKNWLMHKCCPRCHEHLLSISHKNRLYICPECRQNYDLDGVI